MTNELALELFHDFGIKEPDPRLLAQLVKIIKSRGRVMVMQALKAYAQEDLMVKVSEDQANKQPSGAKVGRKKKDAAAGESLQKTLPVENPGTAKGSSKSEPSKGAPDTEGDNQGAETPLGEAVKSQPKAPPAEDSGDSKGSKKPEEPKENPAAEGDQE